MSQRVQSPRVQSPRVQSPKVQSGLDRIAAGDDEARRALPKGARIGLLAHPASVDARLRHARAVLEEAGHTLAALFGPEHGFDGGAQDMIEVGDEDRGGLPVYSLYGSTEEELTPKAEQLQGLDFLVIDLQDVGSRYYTYVWTAGLSLVAAAKAGVKSLILDRPNPLGGALIEGQPQRPGHLSFVGLYPVPVRHGLTLGEVCRMVAELEGVDPAAYEVLPMRGWERAMAFGETGLPWVLPSPNMPTPDTALVYPGGCLIEGTELSEGRGHTRPFEIWGAPWIDGERLAKEAPVEGATLRPLRFEPTFHKHGKESCGGVQVHVTDPARFRPYRAYQRLLAGVRAQDPARFRWRTKAYEFVEDIPAIDLLTGGPEFREALDAGAGPDELGALFAADEAGAAGFAERRQPWLLYPE